MCNDQMLDESFLKEAHSEIYRACRAARKNGGWDIEDLMDTIDLVELQLRHTTGDYQVTWKHVHAILIWKLHHNRLKI